jgi:hypothetical protein
VSGAPRWVHWFHRDVCSDDDAHHALTGATAACGKAVMSPPAMECTTDDGMVTCPRCRAARHICNFCGHFIRDGRGTRQEGAIFGSCGAKVEPGQYLAAGSPVTECYGFDDVRTRMTDRQIAVAWPNLNPSAAKPPPQTAPHPTATPEGT